MNREPVADWTVAASRAAATAVRTRTRRAKSDPYRLSTQRHEQPPEPVRKRDLRLPAEQLARPRDVRLPNLRIVDRQRLEHDVALRSREPAHRLGELEQRHLVRIAEVDREVLAALREQ